MALIDYSLERFPEHIVDHLELINDMQQLEFGVLDLDAEEQAHRTNVMIANWIERLAISAGGTHSSFMTDNSYVGLHEVELIGNGRMEKFDVGFFPKQDVVSLWLSPPSPTITLYSWRVSQLEFGIIWSSFGFRSEPLSAGAEEEIYGMVLAAAQAPPATS